MHIFARYEVSMIKAITGLYTDADANDDNTTRRTEHDCMSSLPNESKSLT